MPKSFFPPTKAERFDKVAYHWYNYSLRKSQLKQGQVEAVIDAKGRHRGLKVWIICAVCVEGRWIRARNLRLKSFTGMCAKCHNKFTSASGENHPQWKGGTHSWSGYKLVRIYPDNPFYNMTRKTGYISEHRYVMAQHRGRCLERWEIVHHLNGIRDDNRIENLELTPSRQDHLPSMMIQQELQSLRSRVAQLERQLYA